MVNSLDFSKRLEKIIDFYDLSASAFAENIGVQRSSISHILSGRNKPSLDFVMKILDTYPEVELYWLLNGKGEFPLTSKTESLKFKERNTLSNENLFSESNSEAESKISNTNVDPVLENAVIASKEKNIERIVIFYKDGSFSNFENSK